MITDTEKSNDHDFNECYILTCRFRFNKSNETFAPFSFSSFISNSAPPVNSLGESVSFPMASTVARYHFGLWARELLSRTSTESPTLIRSRHLDVLVQSGAGGDNFFRMEERQSKENS